MNQREYSKRLGMISDEQLQAALDRFGLGKFVRAEPIAFGLFGQNLFLTSTAGEFVLRGVPHYDWQFPTEQFFAELLHQKTRVPVPYPYLLEPARDIFGSAFVIMPRMAGVQLANEQTSKQLSRDDRRGIARAMASMLVEAQSLTWEHAGKYDPASGRILPMPEDYRAWVVRRVRELLASAQSINDHTTDADAGWVEAVIAKASPALLAPYQPCVVFEDFKEANVVVTRGPEGWRVSGVFDLMTAHFGDGEADLARLVGSYCRENSEYADAFVQAYLQNKSVQPGFVERQQLYMVYDSLLIWAFWQGHAGGLPEDKTLTLTKWASPFVAYWERYRPR